MAVAMGGVAEHRGPEHVGVDEGERLQQRAVDVRLGREVDDGVDLGREPVDECPVADVALHEPVAAAALELGQVGGVPGVRQLVQHHQVQLRAGLPQQTDEVGADEAGPARHQQALELAAHRLRHGWPRAGGPSR